MWPCSVRWPTQGEGGTYTGTTSTSMSALKPANRSVTRTTPAPTSVAERVGDAVSGPESTVTSTISEPPLTRGVKLLPRGRIQRSWPQISQVASGSTVMVASIDAPVAGSESAIRSIPACAPAV